MKVAPSFAGLLAAALIFVPLSGAAAAAPVDPGAEIERHLNENNLAAAGHALNELVQTRLPPKGAARPDPVLDRLLVKYLSASGASPVASLILARLVAEPATPNRDHYRLLLATFKEATAAFAEAKALYRTALQGAGLSAEDSLSARLGLARLQMITDPAGALAALRAIDPVIVEQRHAWEIDLLAARAASMAVPADTAAVAAALDQAWAKAPQAMLVDAATSRVAGDRALFAARTGDRKTLVTMLAVDRFNRAGNTGQAHVAAALPPCGTGGITREDRVVIEVVRLPAPARPDIDLVWASRPGIAQPFLAAASRSGFLSVNDGQSAMLELACRTAPAVDYTVRNAIDAAATAWMTSRGAYPIIWEFNGGSATAASMLAEREVRYGPNSIMLLPILFGQQPAYMVDTDGDESTRKQTAATMARIGAILIANNAPQDLILMWKLSSIATAVTGRAKTPEDGEAEYQALVTEAATDPKISPDTLYLVASNVAQTPNLSNGFKIGILTRTLDLLVRKSSPGDQRSAALALHLHKLRRDQGDDAGAGAALNPIGLAADLCIRSNPPSRYLSSNIGSDRYPGDLTFIRMPGFMRTEIDLDESGNARNGRIILADPPRAFDQATLTGLATIRHEPARIGGSAVACRAIDRTIRWQMPQ
jgi:hypothetical protein